MYLKGITSRRSQYPTDFENLNKYKAIKTSFEAFKHVGLFLSKQEPFEWFMTSPIPHDAFHRKTNKQN